jgi:hypothetical protein
MLRKFLSLSNVSTFTVGMLPFRGPYSIILAVVDAINVEHFLRQKTEISWYLPNENSLGSSRQTPIVFLYAHS